MQPHRKLKAFLKGLGVAMFAAAVICFVLLSNAGPKVDPPGYGVTFSEPYAAYLGLDWKAVYTEMLDDLGVRRVRLSAYWDDVEPKAGQFDFADLDWQVAEAKKRDASVLLAVGIRLPRWPECHVPTWTEELSAEGATERALLNYVRATVARYASNTAVTAWQVENEPFLGSFGECPPPDSGLLNREIATVRSIDATRPVVVTESGELSTWTKAARRGDVFGTTLYKYIYSDVLHRYYTHRLPAALYRLRAGWVRLLAPGTQVAIVELQAEPWTTRGVQLTPLEDQFKTMSLDQFKEIVALARETGFSPQYLWGVEWWYWLKMQGHGEHWDYAKQIFSSGN